MKERSVRLITKVLTLDHLRSLNPDQRLFVPGQAVTVFRSGGNVEHDWVLVETLGQEVVVARLEKDSRPVSRAS